MLNHSEGLHRECQSGGQLLADERDLERVDLASVDALLMRGQHGLFPDVVGQGLFTPTLSSVIASAVDPAVRGEAFGVQQSASALGRIAGPVLAGLLFQHVAVASPYILAAVLVMGAWLWVPRGVAARIDQ